MHIIEHKTIRIRRAAFYNRENIDMDLSIVIPAFEESKKIGADIEAASAFLDGSHLTGEIIVVDDGSHDRTSEAAKNAAADLASRISFQVIRCEQHRGKGYAIRVGIKKTSGEYVMFADSGCCVPYGNVLRGLDMLKNGACDIVHGSRKLRESRIQKPQGWYRRICSKIFHWFVIYVMKIPAELTDTQCGFKIYRGDVARKLYSRCISDGFMFDVEIILRAQKQAYHMKEFPIEWTCDRDSRLSPARSLWRVLGELIAIRKAIHDSKRDSSPPSE
ncbi:MAG: glycosyltransferase [Planctomycetota bacterium]